MLAHFGVGIGNVWRWYRARRWWWQTAIGIGLILVGLTVVGAILPKKHDQPNGVPPSLTRQQAQAIADGATARAAAPSPTLTAEQIVYTQAVATSESQARLDREATIAAQPTRTPVPTPRPNYDLALLAQSCTTQADIGFTTCEGSVKNVSVVSLRNVEVVVEAVTADGVVRSSDEALISYNPLLPDQESPWKVISTYNPAFTGFRVQFKLIGGGTLLTDYAAIHPNP